MASVRRRTRLPPFKACRKCKALAPREAERCPVCGSPELSEDWEGALIIVDTEASIVAEKMKVDKPGRYALRVR